MAIYPIIGVVISNLKFIFFEENLAMANDSFTETDYENNQYFTLVIIRCITLF